MTSMRISVAFAAAAVAFTMLSPGSASAACYNGLGCTDSNVFPYPALERLSCDWLWTIRNTIFYENGYCFQTRRGQATFDNAGCSYYNSGSVPMSRTERNNVNRILRVERGRGCR